MGFCCDEDEEDEMHRHLNPTVFTQNLTLAPSPSTSSVTGDGDGDVISPMNSHFSALTCRDTLRLIFEKLPASDLARSCCVCRIWNSVGSDRDIMERAFLAPWKLSRVVGDRLSGSFWRDNSLAKFAISHRIVRGDSVASLAVKYSVQVMDIKRLNNMMSDHGIYLRDRLLIPISDPKVLVGGTCFVELDSYAKREVAVLYLDGSSPNNQNTASSFQWTTSLQAKKRVIRSLKRTMLVDDSTAAYYLSISNGDPRAALSEFSGDLQWEREVGQR